MDGDSNGLETAAGASNIAMANGRDLLPDFGDVGGDGCVKSFTLDRYLEVVPTGDWTLTITSPTPTATRTKTSPSRTRTAGRTPTSPQSTPSKAVVHRHKTKHTSAPPSKPKTSAPASCEPLTNGGNCYEPGEFCRKSDEGVTGVAGDGETIICEDNNGLRWEPV